MIFLKNHFHLVQQSPWPILMSMVILYLMSSMLFWMKTSFFMNIFISSLFLIILMSFWWRDIIRESTFSGFHLFKVQMGLKIGMLLLIFSEVMFFISFFWMFFHSSLSPSMETGLMWPPISVFPLNPFSIPFLNTLILVSSGLTVTLSHHLLMENFQKKILFNSKFSLLCTIFLGLLFSFFQLKEYQILSFTISDSIFGSIFFVATGFHGLHVMVGSIFLFVCLIRMTENHFSKMHMIGYELSIWYWHFVDVVWLFLFFFIYWWGS